MLDSDVRLYVQLLSEGSAGVPTHLQQLPPIDAYLVADELIVEFEVPGVSADQLPVRVESHLVNVEGRREQSMASVSEPLISQRAHGEFHCRLLLGDRCDVDQVDAHLVEGVLTLSVPLISSAATRHVLVTEGNRSANHKVESESDPSFAERSFAMVK